MDTAAARSRSSLDRVRQSVEISSWAADRNLQQVWVACAPVGYTRTRLEGLEVALGAVGIPLIRFAREYDRLVWPHCSKGFFQLRKRIPAILDALAVDAPSGLQVPIEGA